jgi:glutaredoxin-related protein
MPRPILAEGNIHPAIRDKVDNYQADLVGEVQAAIAEHDVVIVGMSQNPHPGQARKLLDSQNIEYRYLEYGSYVSQWRRRLTLKMWTGWSTFPMVFVKGTLVGGASDLKKLADSGELERMLRGE